MPDFGSFRGFGEKLVQGQTPTQLGKIGAESFNNLLLDFYPNSAAAFSIRKLRNAYLGSAIRVRRTSDNAEQNIGFDQSGNLDTTSLTAFCGSSNGFVTTWYDQSGNGRDVIQSAATNQPQIVSNGAVINVNSKPSVRFQDATDLLRCITATGTSTSNTMATVQKFNSTSGYGITMSFGDTSQTCFAGVVINTGNRGIYTVSAQSSDGAANTNQEIWGITTAIGAAKLWANGASQALTNNTQTYTANLNDIMIGNDRAGSSRLPNMQEAIYWAVTQSDSNLVAINTNQNTYFNVY